MSELVEQITLAYERDQENAPIAEQPAPGILRVYYHALAYKRSVLGRHWR